MAGKQKHTREFRESAVRLVIAEGRRPEEAAANLGMPVNTLMARVSKARRNLSGGAFTPPSGIHRLKHRTPRARTMRTHA